MVAWVRWLVVAAVCVTSTLSSSISTSDTRCDVEALRCHVICTLSDLTLPCDRCVKRRPMRFGKRSGKRPQPSSFVSNTRPLKKYKTSNEPLFEDSAMATDDTLLQERNRKRSHKKGVLANRKVKYFSPDADSGAYSVRSPGNRRPSWNYDAGRRPFERDESLGFQNVRDSKYTRESNPIIRSESETPEMRESDTIGLNWYPARRVHEDPGFHEYPTIYLGEPVAQDVEGDDERKRRRRRSVLEDVSNDRIVSSFSSIGSREIGDEMITEIRPKKSAILDIVKEMMELLGLKELPVDPRLHGCHELVSAFF